MDGSLWIGRKTCLECVGVFASEEERSEQSRIKRMEQGKAMINMIQVVSLEVFGFDIYRETWICDATKAGVWFM